MTRAKNLVDTALSYLRAGLCVLPASAETKHPDLKAWKDYQSRLPTESEVGGWFHHATGIAIVTGPVSGGADGHGLFLMDFDQKGKSYRIWRQSIPADLFERLVIETTQHGGYHVYWRSPAAVTRCEKFARDDNGVLIESRCAGGLVIAAPTPGYCLVQGSLTALPVLSAEEHETLLSAARVLDRTPRKAAVSSTRAPMPPRDGELRPGDDFNLRGQDMFRDLLIRHGWRLLGRSGDNEQWQRPGKEGAGLSATFDNKTFYVFTTNAAPFEENQGYSPFRALAMLEHGGDYAAAARSLAAQGFGAPRMTIAEVSSLPEEGEESDEGDPPADRMADPGVIPEKLCQADGVIGALTDLILKMSPRPNVRLAFAGALTVWAHICSIGRIADTYDTRPNLYTLCLGDSGSGKNSPRKVIKLIMAVLGAGGSVVDSFGSGAGLEDCFIDNRAVISLYDEFHKLFAALKDRDSMLGQGIVQTLLQLYTESDQVHVFRRLAMTRQSERSRRPRFVEEPHLTLFATGIPALTFGNLSCEAMTDGLAARCLLIEAGERGPAGAPHREDIPSGILDAAGGIISRGEVVEAASGVLRKGPALIVGETDEAKALRAALVAEADRLYARAPASEQGAADRALYARVVEKAAKLALVFAVSANPRNPCIEAVHLRHGWDISLHSTERIRWLANRYLFENEYDALAKRALRFLGGRAKATPRSALLRSLHVDKVTFDRIVGTLIESRQIISVPGTRAGAVQYKLA
ncbi:MAG: bifunctional DNA primase/polymerase [Kiritimatiellae bacterium]|nr:bifunctional DNA primase/polymerase [Kiritimatiellia bacterium]